MKLLYLDSETTGVNPNINSIIEIAGMIEEKGEIISTFNHNCRPTEEISLFSQTALDTNKKTVAEIIAYPDIDLIVERLVQLFKSHTTPGVKESRLIPCGYNVKFDIEFLISMFEKAGRKKEFFFHINPSPCLDVMALVNYLRIEGVLKLENSKLTTVCSALNINIKDAHSALADVEMTRELYKKLNKIYLKINNEPQLSLFDQGAL